MTNKRSQRVTVLAATVAASLLIGPVAVAAEDVDSTQGVKVTGFAAATAAFTYGEPEHWSRGVGRLQLGAQGQLTENVKWKVSGRGDVDVVYLSSGFYPDAVKRDQRARFYHRETYLDASAGDWDLRVGAQQIVWGEVVGLFFADVVSARDQREFLLPGFDVIRIPQWAVRLEHFSGDSHVEAVWIPVPAFDQIGKPGSDFYPIPVPAELQASFLDPRKPARNLGNGNFGIRANTLVAGWDVAGFYYRSFSTMPTFYREGISGATGLPVYQPRFDRIWQTGATLTKDFGEIVMRAEAVYSHGQGFATLDPTASEGVIKRNTLDWVASVEFTLPHDTRVNLQGFQRKYFGGGEDDLMIKADGFGASVLVSSKLTATLEPQVLWIQNFSHAGGLVRPRLNWYPAKNYTVGVGLDIFTGPSDGYFGRYNNRDRAYAEVRFDF